MCLCNTIHLSWPRFCESLIYHDQSYILGNRQYKIDLLCQALHLSARKFICSEEVYMVMLMGISTVVVNTKKKKEMYNYLIPSHYFDYWMIPNTKQVYLNHQHKCIQITTHNYFAWSNIHTCSNVEHKHKQW